MKVLFVCNMGLQRSPTAAELFKDRFETRYCGVFTDEEKKIIDDLRWSDTVVCMEEQQREELVKQFADELFNKNLFVLGVPDVYLQGDEKLVLLLHMKMNEIGLA